MTSFKPSEARTQVCETCGNRLTSRPAKPFPIVLQIVFASSFVVFLLMIDRIRPNPILLWGWSAAQLILGIFLIRARRLAGKRILICIHCAGDLR